MFIYDPKSRVRLLSDFRYFKFPHKILIAVSSISEHLLKLRLIICKDERSVKAKLR